MNEPRSPGYGPRSDAEWDDARLDRAFRSRFDVDPPAGLADCIAAELSSAVTGSRPIALRPIVPDLARAFRQRPTAGVIAAAVVLVVVALGASGLVGPRPAGTPVPSRSTSALSTATPSDGQPAFPATVIDPASGASLPVLSVADALSVRASGDSQEIAVGGWFIAFAVPCPVLPDAFQPLENCGENFSWLMAAPETLLVESTGVVIRPPSGPAFNPVTDWRPADPQAPAPVVFAGHFHDPRATKCPSGDRRTTCGNRFVVTGVPWPSSTDTEGFPNEVFGLPVKTVPEARLTGAHGSGDELAVEGWYQQPAVVFCPFQPAHGFGLLEGDCSLDRTWLMEAPESLIEGTPTTRPDGTVTIDVSGRVPTGLAVHPVFPNRDTTWAHPLPPAGASTPTPVVLVGHFNDRRVAFCSTENANVCAARFVVDAIAWADGTSFAPQSIDWRAWNSVQGRAADPVAEVGAFAPDSSLLNVLALPGARIGDIEPAVGGATLDLSNQPSLYVVTVLEPNGLPPWAKTVFVPGPYADTFVMTPDGTLYEASGSGFRMVMGPAATPVVSPSP